MYDLGEMIRLLRESKGLSQEQLGRKVNKSKSMISKYESGYQMPPMSVLIDIAKVFNTSLDSLAGLDKGESIVVEGLTDDQKELLRLIVDEFQNKKLNRVSGLTQRQQEILNELIVQFDLANHSQDV